MLRRERRCFNSDERTPKTYGVSAAVHPLRRKRPAPGTGGRNHPDSARRALCAARGVADGHVDCAGGGWSWLWNGFGGQLSLQHAAIHRESYLRLGSGITDQPPGFCGPRDGLSLEAGPAAGGMSSDWLRGCWSPAWASRSPRPAGDNRAGGGDGGTVRVASEVNGFLAKIESVAQG